MITRRNKAFVNDAGVHLEWELGDVLQRGGNDLDADFILEETLLEDEAIKNGRLSTIKLLNGGLIANVARGEAAAILVDRAHGKRETVLFNKLIEVELHAETQIAGVDETPSHADDKVADDAFCVAGG
jgi:hypothetical protein